MLPQRNKPAKGMLASLGWQVAYEMDTLTPSPQKKTKDNNKKTLETNVLGHWRITTVQRFPLSCE